MTFPSLCPVALVFGQPCPGCGMGRSLIACACGDFSAAFRWHPLGPPALLAAIVYAALEYGAPRFAIVHSARAAICRVAPRRATWWWVVLTLTMAVWVARFGGAWGGPVPVYSPLKQWLAGS